MPTLPARFAPVGGDVLSLRLGERVVPPKEEPAICPFWYFEQADHNVPIAAFLRQVAFEQKHAGARFEAAAVCTNDYREQYRGTMQDLCRAMTAAYGRSERAVHKALTTLWVVDPATGETVYEGEAAYDEIVNRPSKATVYTKYATGGLAKPARAYTHGAPAEDTFVSAGFLSLATADPRTAVQGLVCGVAMQLVSDMKYAPSDDAQRLSRTLDLSFDTNARCTNETFHRATALIGDRVQGRPDWMAATVQEKHFALMLGASLLLTKVLEPEGMLFKLARLTTPQQAEGQGWLLKRNSLWRELMHRMKLDITCTPSAKRPARINQLANNLPVILRRFLSELGLNYAFEPAIERKMLDPLDDYLRTAYKKLRDEKEKQHKLTAVKANMRKKAAAATPPSERDEDPDEEEEEEEEDDEI